MRFPMALFPIPMFCLVIGCGGGGSSSSSGGSGPVPEISSISPQSLSQNSLGTLLTVSGSGFQSGATIEWNGVPLSTTIFGDTKLTTTIPTADLTTQGNVNITVNNTGTGNAVSNAMVFEVTGPAANQTWVRSVSGIGTLNWISSDIVHGELYASMASTDPNSPNSILPVDPVAGTAASPVPAGNNPDRMTISSDSSYLWAGIDGDHTIQRFLLPGLSPDISFPLPTDPQLGPEQAVSLEAAPVDPHTIAVVAGSFGIDPPGNGVYVFDDAVQRPNSIAGPIAPGGAMIDWIQWGADDSTIYGDQYTTMDAGGIADIQVSPAGAQLLSYGGGLTVQPTISQFVPGTGLLYSFGGVYNPVSDTVVGGYSLPETGTEACTPDSTIGRYYCFTAYSADGVDITYFELWVFDLNSFAFLNRISFGTSSNGTAVTGRMLRLVRWGRAGLALATYAGGSQYGNGGLFLIDGAAVNPNATPDSTQGTAGVSMPNNQ